MLVCVICCRDHMHTTVLQESIGQGKIVFCNAQGWVCVELHWKRWHAYYSLASISRAMQAHILQWIRLCRHRAPQRREPRVPPHTVRSELHQRNSIHPQSSPPARKFGARKNLPRIHTVHICTFKHAYSITARLRGDLREGKRELRGATWGH
jgi:hypothetical protein